MVQIYTTTLFATFDTSGIQEKQRQCRVSTDSGRVGWWASRSLVAPAFLTIATLTIVLMILKQISAAIILVIGNCVRNIHHSHRRHRRRSSSSSSSNSSSSSSCSSSSSSGSDSLG